MSEIVEVNGVKYKLVEDTRSKNASFNPRIMGILMAAQMMYGGMGIREKKIPPVDIVEEYGKIQRKESGLSRSQRDAVVAKFESTFKKV